MTKTKNSRGRRVLTLAVLALTLISLLFSLTSCGSCLGCGGCAGGTTKAVYEDKAEGVTDADYIAGILAKTDSYRLRMLAADRGYDLLSENFKDSGDILDNPHYEAAKKILQDVRDEKNFKATSTSNGDKIFEEYIATIDLKNSEADAAIKAIINSESFKTAPTTSGNASFPGILLVWIGKFLGLITDLVGGYYVLAIMLFAILIEIVMLPMSIKQQKNTIGMAKLRPAIAKIEKKYAGRVDQVTLRKKQEEIMALQQKEGFSPYSGCLPLIIQLIVVGFILYPIIQNPLSYMLDSSDQFASALSTYAIAPEAAGGLGKSITSGSVMELLESIKGNEINGLANFGLYSNGDALVSYYNSLQMPKFTAFGLNLGVLPEIASIFVIIPIVNIIGQWGSMFLTRRWNNTGYSPLGDRQDKFSFKMMDLLPLFMTAFILFKVPAMIGIYWFFRSLISLGKQYMLKLAMPVPKYTEEELREIERAEKERQKAQKAAAKQQPKYRSLHYIDEEDYEELPEIKQSNTNAPKKLDSSDAPEIKD